MTTDMIPQHNNSLSTEQITIWQQTGIDWLRNLKSERTRQTYSRAWQDFLTFTGLQPYEVTQSDVIAFKTDLGIDYSDRPAQANTTINLKLAALSSFYRFAITRGLIDNNPCDGVKRLKVKPYGKATYLSADENQDTKLLEQPDTDTLIGKRDYAILLLLLTTGVRVSALAKATVANVQKQATGYKLAYVNKGGDDVTADVLPFVYDAIQDYLKARGNVSNKAPLFMTIEANRTGKQVKPLSRHAITAMISRYAKQAGLHHITAHSLRHTAAMIAAKYGTIAQVKGFLRHESVRTTAIYLDHVGDEDVHEMTSAVGKRYAE